jgi:hypothetical protein
MKQRLFVKEYVKNKGNGTVSALKVYDTTKPEIANAIAVENLQKPSVKEELDRILTKENIKLDSIVDNIASIATEKPIKGFSGADILEANKTILKLHGALTDRKTVTSYTINADLEKLSTYDLIQKHKKLTEETQEILQGDE